MELWRDPLDGELALRVIGGDEWTIVRGQTLIDVDEGNLEEVAVHATAGGIWRAIRIQYRLTKKQVDDALSSGDPADRPQLMNVPDFGRTTRAYLFVRDFDGDVRALQRAASFRVPAPGPKLAGLTLAKAALAQSRGPGCLTEPGYVADLEYSAVPELLGTGEHQLTINAAAPGTGAADSYRRFFGSSTQRLTGPGYDARWTERGVVLRYRRAYVLVLPHWSMALGQLRNVVRRRRVVSTWARIW